MFGSFNLIHNLYFLYYSGIPGPIVAPGMMVDDGMAFDEVNGI
jgi:hypothetical protein